MQRVSRLGLATFLVVAFAIPWSGWLLLRSDALSLWLFPLFASLAGFVAAFIDGGGSGLAAFSRRVLATRSALPAIGVGLIIPLLLGLSYLLVNGMPLSQIELSPAAVLGLSLGAALVTGPLAEEFGWRGYLQPALLSRMAPFWAALVVGLVWWLWHYALYWNSVFQSPTAALHFLAYLLTWSLFMVFLVQRTGGSVWPAVALHWAANTHPNVLQALLPSLDGGSLPGGSKGSLYYLAAACTFALFHWRFFFARQPPAEAVSKADHLPAPPQPSRAS